MIYGRYRSSGCKSRWTECCNSGVPLEIKLNNLKDKFEVKLEKTDTIGNPYKATHQGTTITPEAVNDSSAPATYKGFKHPITTGQKINRITIHNHVIQELTSELSKFVPGTNGGVFVYFTSQEATGNREKPLLICLSKNGTQSNEATDNNTWYKRKKEGDNFTWDKVTDGTYDEIKPGGTGGTTIEDGLKTQLGIINGQVSGDPGYPKPKYILKLYYVPKQAGTSDSIKYVTGNSPTPANRVITVTKDATGNVPTGYVAYSHDPTDRLTNVKFKHNGNPIELRGVRDSITIGDNKRVWIFYKKDDTDTPLLLYYQDSDNNWYGKGMRWVEDTVMNTIDASASLPDNTTDASNQTAIDAIAVINNYTDPNLPAHTSIGYYATPDTAAHVNDMNWNIYSHDLWVWLYFLEIGNWDRHQGEWNSG